MRKIVVAVLLGFLLLFSTFAEQSVVGTYTVVLFVIDIDGVPSDALGKVPRGYLIVTPTPWIVLLTAESRKFVQLVEDRAAPRDPMNAHAGTYLLEGNKVIVALMRLTTNSGTGLSSRAFGTNRASGCPSPATSRCLIRKSVEDCCGPCRVGADRVEGRRKCRNLLRGRSCSDEILQITLVTRVCHLSAECRTTTGSGRLADNASCHGIDHRNLDALI